MRFLMSKFLIFSLLVAYASLAIASGQPTKVRNAATLGLEDLRAQVEKSDQFPSEGSPKISWLIAPKKMIFNSTHLMVGVSKIRFNGLTNEYCRLAVSNDKEGHTFALVPVPESANYNTCKGVRSFKFGDLNGDGLMDYWYIAKVQSNRYPIYVDEALVFLGNTENPGELCYSASASHAINPVDTSLAAVIKAIDTVLKHKGKTKLKCD